MKLPSPLSSFLYKCDLFSTKIGFRFKQERQYASLTGGVISLLMIALFIGIFTNTGLNTINKEYIIASQNKKIYEDPKYLSLSKDKNFFFMIGLSNIDMNKDIRYFDISMTYTTYLTSSNTTKKIKNKVPLVPCKRQIWATFQNNSIVTTATSLNVQKWLCPPQNDTFQLKGKFTSEQFKFIKFSVQKCNPDADASRRCATSAELSDYLIKNEAFTLNYYFVNSIVNPQQKDHIKYYLQDKNYFPFTLTQGLNANLYVSKYNVKTDQSLLPLQQIQQNTGGIVRQSAQFYPYYVAGTQYVKFYLRKSNQQINIIRSFKKIDDTLSYIGGLFSSLLTFLVIVCFYNQLSYQLQIAKNIYRYDQDTLLDTNGFHFLNYIIYLFYFVLKLIGLKPNWTKMEHFDKSLVEVRKQMDVRLIFKKILFTQKLASAILSHQQLTALHLQDKITISKAQEIRQNYFLPKLLIKEIKDQKSVQRDNSKKRLQTQHQNEQQNSSNIFVKKIDNINQNKQEQQQSHVSSMIKQQLIDEENRSNQENNRTIITNSLSAISFKGKTSQVYHKIIEIIYKLVSEQANGDLISKKILSGISPQIKQLLNIESNEKGSSTNNKIELFDLSSLPPVNHHSRHNSNTQNQNQKVQNKFQVVQIQNNQLYPNKRRSGQKITLPKLIHKKNTQNYANKQIKNIFVVQDFTNQ